MKFYFVIGIAVLSTCIGGCKKGFWKDETDIYQVPISLFFIVKENNQRLPDSVLNSMKLAFYEGGIKKFVSDFGRASEGGFPLGVQVSRNIGFISSQNSVKDYYLEYPNGSIDTLYVDYKLLTFSEAKNHPCRCMYPMEQPKFNGQVAELDSSLLDLQGVYIFQK